MAHCKSIISVVLLFDGGVVRDASELVEYALRQHVPFHKFQSDEKYKLKSSCQCQPECTHSILGWEQRQPNKKVFNSDSESESTRSRSGFLSVPWMNLYLIHIIFQLSK